MTIKQHNIEQLELEYNQQYEVYNTSKVLLERLINRLIFNHFGVCLVVGAGYLVRRGGYNEKLVFCSVDYNHSNWKESILVFARNSREKSEGLVEDFISIKTI